MDMHTRMISSNKLLILATALVLMQVCPALGQVATPANNGGLEANSNNENAPNEILFQGKQLEEKGHWAEALSLYQTAIKDFPRNNTIRQRSKQARLHYEIEKRYADPKFVESLKSTTPTKSLNVFAEVLLKIQSYYVDKPDWHELVGYGWKSLEIAAQSPEFRSRNIPKYSTASVIKAIRQAKASLAKQPIRSRHEAYVHVNSAAQMLNRSIGLPMPSTMYEFTNGAITALDPYSAFMSNSQYNETMSQIEGNFVGLGVELRTHTDHLEIVSVIPGGPASKGNVAKADRIIAVDDVPVSKAGSEKAADMLRGVEGSYVKITVEREGMKTQSVRLQRKRVDIPSVDKVSIIDRENGVGYIRLVNFQKTTARDFDAALWRLHRAGMKSLIVDVRGNPGGLLSASVEVADRFVSNGVIVSTRGRNPLEDYTHTAERDGTWRVPLVVLVDENSASASEIFAAAIRDHQRGQIVGRQSYGKGSVQGIFPLNVSGGGVRLTTAKFYSPTGKPINQVGVRPDIKVQVRARPGPEGTIATNGDNELRVAVQVANRQSGKMAHQPSQRQNIAGR